jgi:N-acyl-L-homoserine lactone synthetase
VKEGGVSAPSEEPKIVVRPAESGDLLQAVFRLRYEVLVEQENLEIPSADHDARTIEDDYDERAYVLAASTGSSEVVGTARTVLWRSLPSSLVGENGVPDVLARIGFTPPSLNGDACSYSSRMVIAKGAAHEKYRVARLLARALCHYGTRAGVQVDFILCVSEYLAFFKRLGYRELASGIESPDTQRQCYLMYLLVEDAAHLHKVQSPLADFCPEPESQRHEALQRTIEDYAEEFRRRSRPVPS